MVFDIVIKARELRNNPTNTEKFLWQFLKQRKTNGLKFRRQQVVGSYIADFACLEKRIIIEVDGYQHRKRKKCDKEKDKYLKN